MKIKMNFSPKIFNPGFSDLFTDLDKAMRFGAKRPRGHLKGGLDPLGSSDHRKMDAPHPPPPGGGQRAAAGYELLKI